MAIRIFRHRLTSPAKASGVVMIVSLLIITGAFVISLSIASLVMLAINISRTQGDSIRAYFAADSGLERALAFDKIELIDRRNCGAGGQEELCCDTQPGSCLFFDQEVYGEEEVSGCAPCGMVLPQDMNTDNHEQTYRLIYQGTSDDDSELYLQSTGNSNGVKRSINLTISRTTGCQPICSEGEGDDLVNYECGYNSCNGFCGVCSGSQICSNHYCVGP